LVGATDEMNQYAGLGIAAMSVMVKELLFRYTL
jgi:hypothetical protein